MTREYKVAPLPFIGQKRMFAAKYKQVLKDIEGINVVVDLFGGSGLLSHITKRQRPELTVVYNDFNNYRQRLANVDNTNAILGKLREMEQLMRCLNDISKNGFEAFADLEHGSTRLRPIKATLSKPVE